MARSSTARSTTACSQSSVPQSTVCTTVRTTVRATALAWTKAIAPRLSVAMALLLSTATLAQAATHTLSSTSPTLEIQGVSGGASLVGDCADALSALPSQEIVLTETFIQQSGFLKFTLDAPGLPVLVLDGPAGRFCALGDSAAQQKPEVSGYWLPGSYRVYVGDRTRASQTYKLTVQ